MKVNCQKKVLGTKISMKLSNLGDYRSTGNPQEIRFCCHQCNDTKYHLYFNTQKQVGICFRCGETYKLFGRTQFKKVIESPPETIESYKFYSVNNEKSTVAESARQYLENRGILNHKDLLYGTKDNWLGRVVFPIKEENKTVFATGRTFISANPKYLNTKGKKSEYLYNIENAKQHPSVVICEGVFDSLSIPGGIALLGKDMSDIQYRKIRDDIPNSKPIYVGLDGDCIKTQGIEIAERLATSYDKVFLLDLPIGKDINKMRRELKNIPIIKVTTANLIKFKLGCL